MSTPEVSKARILVVDDEPHNLLAMQELLSGPDREVVTVDSGAQALREILKADFALILLDVRMPEMDGFETATLLRKIKRSRYTPIMFLTALNDRADLMLRGYEVGAVDYICKPVDPEVLKSKVAVFVELGSQSAGLASQVLQRTASLLAANELLRKEVARRERAEEELLEAKRVAEAANLAKSEFLANMSHEIRTPMNAIIAITELALGTELSAEQREYLSLLKASGESLLAIASGILDFSKIEAGRLEVERVPFSLRECLEATMKTLAVEARKKGLALTWEIAPSMPDALLGDPMRLRQIVFNLVANAIKFTEAGSVRLRVEPQHLASEEVECHCAVIDTGIGIPADKQATVFAPFLQADTSTTRVYGGTGLGLTIAARLVEKMRGRIWLDSQPGKGSTFHFTVRLRRQEPTASADSAPAVSERAPTQALQLLLVEDNPLNRRLAQIILEKAGHEVTAVDNGADALKALKDRSFQLVVLDVEMPRMDGIATARAIREAERDSGRHVPIIAVTAHAIVGDRERCLAAGMDAYLVKPIRPATLVGAVAQVHAATVSTAPTSGPRATLDRAELLERVGGDAGLLGEIGELFVHESAKLVSRVRAAIQARDAAAFAREVHTLRGMLRNVSAHAAEDAAAALQSLDLAREPVKAEQACEQLADAVLLVKDRLLDLAPAHRAA